MGRLLAYFIFFAAVVAVGAAVIYISVRRFEKLRKRDNEENYQLIRRLEGIEREYEIISRSLTVAELQHEINKYEYFTNIEADEGKLIDILVERERNKIEKTGTAFTCEINGVPEFGVLGLISVFTNLLDNALEAAVKTEGGDAFIRFFSDVNEIFVENSKINSESPVADGFKTTKQEKGHGNGVNILKKILGRNGCSIEYKDKGNAMITLIKREKAPEYGKINESRKAAV